MSTATPVVVATGLEKRFGDVVALGGVDLSVPRGSVLALLGPNGAGKTTIVSILATLLAADAGTATVAGMDVRTQAHEVRKLIGLSGQFAAVDEALTGFENLRMIARLYRLGRAESATRARELLERFDLVEAADRPVKTYSGGMRRRLDLACALVAEPPVLFLDEPTTGLDPRSRLDLWAEIRALVARGVTLLLTTQYLEEADQLADDILVLDHGSVIASGTADQLKAQVGGERIELVTATVEQLEPARAELARVASGDVEVDVAARRLLAPIDGGVPVLTRALQALQDADIALVDVGLRRPTLDDVFLTLTGHRAENADATTDDARSDTHEEVQA